MLHEAVSVELGVAYKPWSMRIGLGLFLSYVQANAKDIQVVDYSLNISLRLITIFQLV